MEYASSFGVSILRSGVPGFDFDGVLKLKSRLLVGVDGGAIPEDCRTGDDARTGLDGATSVCNRVVKIELACSLRASDSVGMSFFVEVDGDLSSSR